MKNYQTPGQQNIWIEKVRRRITEWGSKNLRDYPWRKTKNPYEILVAEFMLHRTRAEQVKIKYDDFIKKYPDFASIVESGQKNIRMEFQELGLAWRSNSLYSLSEIVIKKYDGKLPLDKDILLSLPGVGNYIALAVICFSTGIPEPILDTNTVRIIGRIFNLKINDSSRRNMKFEKIMWKLVEQSDPEIFLFSMIDFGAKICTSQKPKCGLCPVNDICCFTTKNGGKLK